MWGDATHKLLPRSHGPYPTNRGVPPQLSHGPGDDARVNDVLESQVKSLKRESLHRRFAGVKSLRGDSLKGVNRRGGHRASIDLKFKLGRARLSAPRRFCGFSSGRVETD
jgi:hypothetical protein